MTETQTAERTPARRTIVVVDDDPSFLAMVRQLLEAEGFAVVGEAETGLDGVRAATELSPDLVLVDVTLPDIDGFEVVERLAGLGSTAAAFLTSTREESDFGGLVGASPARAFISKGDISGEALTALLDSPSRRE
jgi:CheY-like chemotaxis protein